MELSEELSSSSDMSLNVGGMAVNNSNNNEGVYVSGTANGQYCFVHHISQDSGERLIPMTGNGEFACHSLTLAGQTLVWTGVSLNQKTPFGYVERYSIDREAMLSRIMLGDLEYPFQALGSSTSTSTFLQSIPTINHPLKVEYPTWMQQQWANSVPTYAGSMTIRKYKDTTIQWQREILATTEGNNVAPIFPAGMVEFPDFLAVAGSTNGLNYQWLGDADDFGDFDGFVTLLDKTTGSLYTGNGDEDGDRKERALLRSRDHNSHRNLQEDSAPGSIRLGTKGDDHIIRICNNSQNDNSFYAVGATNGNFQTLQAGSSQAFEPFLLKLVVENGGALRQVWTRQLQGLGFATHCVAQNTQLYVGGVTQGSINNLNNIGNNDVWLAQFDTNTGSQGWIQQVGTDQDDRLADLQIIEDELVVLAETQGDWINEHQHNSKQEVVIAKYKLQDGSSTYATSPTSTTNNNNDNIDAVGDDDVGGGQSFYGDYTPAPSETPIVGDTFNDDQINNNSTGGDNFDDDIDNASYYPEDAGNDMTDNDGIVDNAGYTDDQYYAGTGPGSENPYDDNASVPAATPTTPSNNGFLPGFDQSQANKQPSSFSSASFASSTIQHGKGFQSNMGPSYAGGMLYDFTRNEVYLTGQTYGVAAKHDTPSSCFLLQLPLIDDSFQTKSLKTTSSDTACSSMAQVYDHLVISGIQMVEQDTTNRQYGSITTFTRDLEHPHWNIAANDQLLNPAIVTPISILPTSANSWMVANVVSDDTNLSQLQIANQAKEPNGFPNFTAGGHIKYGSAYFIQVDQLTPGSANGDTTPQLETFVKLRGDANSMLFASGMALIGDSVLVVGSTMGNVPSLDKQGSKDMDGFLVKKTLTNSGGENQNKPVLTKRLSSPNNENDWIMNICNFENNVFVVGATMGSMEALNVDLTKSDTATTPKQNTDGSVHAFVSQIHADTLEPIWTQQFYVRESGGTSAAFGCAVAGSGDLLYVGGVAKNGSSMDYPHAKSYGSDDIFVAQVFTNNGDIRWLEQLGSSGHESLARSGGILTDMDDNAVLYGDTTGELYRSRSRASSSGTGESDLFVVTLDKKDGSYALTVEENRVTQTIGIVVALGCVVLFGVVVWIFRKWQAKSFFLNSGETRSLMLPKNDGIISGSEMEPNLHPTQDDPLNRPGRRLV